MTKTQNKETESVEFAFDQEIYNKFVERIELFDIRLINFMYNSTPSYFEIMAKEEELQAPNALKRSFHRELSKPHHSKEDEILVSNIEWRIEIRKGRKKVLEIKANYLVAYEKATAVEDEYVSKFINRVVPFTTYPYFREKVSNFSWASGANLPILPVLKAK